MYFVADDDVIGTMAEKAIVDVRRATELPDDVDTAKIAANHEPGGVGLDRAASTLVGSATVLLSGPVRTPAWNRAAPSGGPGI
jgi:hypothetical protein